MAIFDGWQQTVDASASLVDMTTTLTARPEFAAGTWTLDPAHKELAFTARHLGLSKVRGTFENFDVTVEAGSDGAISVTATVDIASVSTNQEQRDAHLRTSDFFLVDEYPTATYTSTAVHADVPNFTVEGELTLRGVTKPVVLTGEITGYLPEGSTGKPVVGISATTSINRFDFGVDWNAPLPTGGFVVGETIQLSADFELILA